MHVRYAENTSLFKFFKEGGKRHHLKNVNFLWMSL